MTTTSPHNNTVDDAILQALLSGNRARAMLFHMRHYGGTAQDAWRAIKGLAEIPNYEEPAHDPHVDRVERYLRGRHTGSSIKWNTAMACILAIGVVFVVRSWDRMLTGIESYSWPQTSAVVTDIRYYSYSYRAQLRKVTRRFVDYEYDYTVAGKLYSEAVVKQSYVEMFDGPRMKRGQTIRVFFDVGDPSRSVHNRDMYQRALPAIFGIVVMLPPLGLLALSVFFEITYRDLERCDPDRIGLSNNAAFAAVC